MVLVNDNSVAEIYPYIYFNRFVCVMCIFIDIKSKPVGNAIFGSSITFEIIKCMIGCIY